MDKLTAVEWLENQINNMIKNGGDLGDDYPALLKHIEQAKQMEKEYIMGIWSWHWATPNGRPAAMCLR